MAFHQKYTANNNGRDFVIGDLHGMVNEFQKRLEAVAFNPETDRCFSVGDLVDRGEDSLAAARLVLEPWFHAVRGNHEELLIRALREGKAETLKMWRQNGGRWGFKWRKPSDAAREAVELLEPLPWVITIEHRSGKRIGICHAECPVDDWQMIEQAEDDKGLSARMLWARERAQSDSQKKVENVHRTVHGHTVVPWPMLVGNALFIDTGAYLGNPLTLLDLDELP